MAAPLRTRDLDGSEAPKDGGKEYHPERECPPEPERTVVPKVENVETEVTATIDPYFVTTVDSESDEIEEDAVSSYLASTVPDVSPQRSEMPAVSPCPEQHEASPRHSRKLPRSPSAQSGLSGNGSVSPSPPRTRKAKKVIQPLVGDRKAEQAIRRLCHRNPRTGKRKVSSSVAKQFMRGGKSRADLIALFIKNGGNKEKFRRQAEHSITNSKTGKVTVRIGYFTEEDMKTTLSYSEQRIKAVKAYYRKMHKNHPDRKFIRRDKYQPDIRKYWVENSYEKAVKKDSTRKLKADMNDDSFSDSDDFKIDAESDQSGSDSEGGKGKSHVPNVAGIWTQMTVSVLSSLPSLPRKGRAPRGKTDEPAVMTT